ncbi:hypothetical protein Tco_0889202 [Tanacetum coccineum]
MFAAMAGLIIVVVIIDLYLGEAVINANLGEAARHRVCSHVVLDAAVFAPSVARDDESKCFRHFSEPIDHSIPTNVGTCIVGAAPTYACSQGSTSSCLQPWRQGRIMEFGDLVPQF